MFGSTVLEIATGMVFVFLLVSLICSQLGNKISEALNWRARDLERGIRELLLGGEKDTLLNDLYNTFHVQQFKTVIAPAAEWMLKQPALKNFVFTHNQDPKNHDLGPASLPAKSFALGIVQALVPDDAGVTSLAKFQTAVQAKMQPSPLRDALLAVAQQPFTAVEDIRAQIEEVYNSAEDQMTAFYRQHMWHLALTIGLLVSIFFNVDSIAIGFRLWRDPSLRAAVNAAAEKYAAESKPQEARQALDQLNLPIGWQVTTGWTIQGITIPRITPNDWAQEPHGATGLGWLRDALTKILGWAITAAAAAQGAPFWFDMLKRLTQRDSATTPTPAQPAT